MIAAPHGYVLGLAVGIVLECELIVAEAGTKFQITETPRGLGGAKYWGMMHFRGAGAFGTEVALTGPLLHRRGGAGGRRDQPGGADGAPTWTRRGSCAQAVARTRRSACAPRCAPAAGTWTSSGARS